MVLVLQNMAELTTISDIRQRTQCADCFYCQQCGRSRCRLCLENGCKEKSPELKTGFTYGQYLAWKKKRR